MEIRTLKYFLAVIQEGSLSRAAESLHVTQPTLSRQLASLEDELGRQLYDRSHAGISLTDYGIMLAQYAESIVELADKAQEEISLPTMNVSGSVHIAAGETALMGIFVQAMKRIHEQYPLVDFQLYSGTTADLMDGLVRGRYDFLLECEVRAHVNLNSLILPNRDTWGIAMRRDDPLATNTFVTAEDLAGRQLITSRQAMARSPLREWFGNLADTVDVVATYDLPSNARWLIEGGFGIAFTYEKLISTNTSNVLTFVPLEPHIESKQGIIWRKSPLTRQAQIFLDTLQEIVNNK